MKIHAAMVVWGESFTGMFLNQFLPSHLSEGNFPTLCQSHDVLMRIYTTPEDARRMAVHPSFRTLRKTMAVEMLDLPPPDPDGKSWDLILSTGKFNIMTRCHIHTMHMAAKDDGGIMILGPDTVLSEGALARVSDLIGAGKRGVLLNHISVLDETFTAEINRRFPLHASGVRAISPRTLTRLGFEHRHPWMELMFVRKEGFHICSQMYWDGGKDAYLAHAWHMAILFLHPQRLPWRPFWTIDNDYTDQVIDKVQGFFIVHDSDEIALAEILPHEAERHVRPQPYPFSPLRYALGAEGLFLSSHNPHWARQGVWWHKGELPPMRTDLESEALRIVDEILAWREILHPSSQNLSLLDERRRREGEEMLELLVKDIQELESCLYRGSRERHPSQLVYLWANLGKLEGAMGYETAAEISLTRVLDLASTNPHAAMRVAKFAEARGMTALRAKALAQVRKHSLAESAWRAYEYAGRP
jgi:hypothetical protein